MTNPTPRRRRRRANPETNVVTPASAPIRQESVTPTTQEYDFLEEYTGKHRSTGPSDTKPTADTFAPVPTPEPIMDKTPEPAENPDPVEDKKAPLSREDKKSLFSRGGEEAKTNQTSKHRKKPSDTVGLDLLKNNWWILVGLIILIVGTVLVFKEFGTIAAVCVILFTVALFCIEEWFARRNTSAKSDVES